MLARRVARRRMAEPLPPGRLASARKAARARVRMSVVSSTVFHVKPGLEDEFIRRWRGLALFLI